MAAFIPSGNINSVYSQIPSVIVQNFTAPSSIQPVNVGIIACVGTSTYGAVNSPMNFNTPQEGAQLLGPIQNATYDLMTFVTSSAETAGGFGGSPLYTAVRVTDGTDTAASSNILDASDEVGMIATAYWTGTFGQNTYIQVAAGAMANTTKVVIGQLNNAQAIEIYDNIPGTGVTLWQNMVSAINEGTNVNGPSQLIIATLPTSIDSVSVTTPGSYSSLPSVTATIGTGATFSVHMSAVSNLIATPQSGSGSYAPGNTITLAGGTSTTTAILTVSHTQVTAATVTAGGSGGVDGTQTVTGTSGTGTKFQASVTVASGTITDVLSITVAGDYTVNPTLLTAEPVTGASLSGATLNIKMGVLTAAVSTAGDYTVLPSNPVAQASTSGSGTGATFTLNWGLLTIGVVAGGSGYTTSTVLNITGGGGGVAVPIIVTAGAPEYATYQLTGGANGNNGVTNETLIGDDTTTPREGMYALRNTSARILVLVNVDDSTTFSTQLAFCQEEAKLGIGVLPAGTTVANAVTLMQAANCQSIYFKVMHGDWIYYNDTTNNVQRLISPQCPAAGVRAILAPEASTLNKPLLTIFATQQSKLNLPYQADDILSLENVGVDVIALQPPGSVFNNLFTCRLGINTASNVTEINDIDDHVAMIDFYIGFSVGDYLQPYIGEGQSPSTQMEAHDTIQSFLQGLVNAKRIGTSNPSTVKPYIVVCNETNNPENKVRAGQMRVDLEFSEFSIIRNIIVNQTRNGTSLNIGASR